MIDNEINKDMINISTYYKIKDLKPFKSHKYIKLDKLILLF